MSQLQRHRKNKVTYVINESFLNATTSVIQILLFLLNIQKFYGNYTEIKICTTPMTHQISIKNKMTNEVKKKKSEQNKPRILGKTK